MSAYYNENNPEAAAWCRELIKRDLIAPGDVDERSIEDVRPSDLAGYTQCHFFAGIGGWSYALRLAGWPDDRPVWTGSCPCQPFSSAGKGAGFADERHLWPAWFHLIRQCGPEEVLGEQVASKDGLAWFDLVSADMEGANYACGGVDICSAGVTDTDLRQRLYWAGVSLADTDNPRLEGRRVSSKRATELPAWPRGVASRLAYANGQRRDRLDALLRSETEGWKAAGTLLEAARRGEVGLPDRLGGIGRPVEWIACSDGFRRPIEPGTFPLVDDVPARVVRLRGYGNAINAEAAAAFIEAYLDSRAVEVDTRLIA